MNETQQKVVSEFALRQLVAPMLKYPNDLEVATMVKNETIVIEWRTNFCDIGKVVGKNKVNLTAIRTLMQLVAEKNGFKIRVNDLQPAKKGSMEANLPNIENPNWKPEKILAIMREFLETMMKNEFELETENQGDWTTIIINLKENLSISAGQLAFSLGKIFHAIGRTQGRLIKVNANEHENSLKS